MTKVAGDVSMWVNFKGHNFAAAASGIIYPGIDPSSNSLSKTDIWFITNTGELWQWLDGTDH